MPCNKGYILIILLYVPLVHFSQFLSIFIYLGSYHLLPEGGAVCLWEGPKFFGVVKGGDQFFFSVGQRGGGPEFF